MTFSEQMLDIWQNMFTGERKFIFYVGFCILTFVVPFFAIWLSCGMIQLYSYIFLRKKYPEKWTKMMTVSKTKGINYYYKCWLKGEIDKDDIFCKLHHMHDLFGKVCLLIWALTVLSVGILALINNY